MGLNLILHYKSERAVFGCGGRFLIDSQALVAKVHEAVIIHVLGAVSREEVVKGGQEFLRANVDGELIAEVVLFVKFEGQSVVGSVDNHHAIHIVASRHIGDVECLTFRMFVADKSA